MPMHPSHCPNEPRPQGSGLESDAINYALQFDRVDDFVRIPNLTYMDAGPITVEARVRCDVANYGSIVANTERAGIALEASEKKWTFLPLK